MTEGHAAVQPGAGKHVKVNGNRVYIAAIIALASLCGVLLALLLSSFDGRITAQERTLTRYVGEGRMETPQQKSALTDQRIQQFWVSQIQPELRQMKADLLAAVRDHTLANHDGKNGR